MKNYTFEQKSWEYALKMHAFYCENILKFKDVNSSKMLVDRWTDSKNSLEAKYPYLKQ